jgi:hypothetical protein
MGWCKTADLRPVQFLPGANSLPWMKRGPHTVQEHVFIQPCQGGEKPGDHREGDAESFEELWDLVMHARFLMRILDRVEAEFLDSAPKFVLAQVDPREGLQVRLGVRAVIKAHLALCM